MIIILTFLAFLFITATYFYINTISTSMGVKFGIMAAADELIPLYLAALKQITEDEEEISQVKIAHDLGAISEEEANKMLKNIRGAE